MKTLRQNSAILRRPALSGTGQTSIAEGGGREAGAVVIKRLTKLCCWEFTQLQRLHVAIYSHINLHSYT
jgi:hypothetical protein